MRKGQTQNVPRLALATCAQYPDLTEDDRWLIAPLREAGAVASPAVWNDPSVDWASFDCVVIRSCWDYYKRHEDFLGWAASLVGYGVDLWNRPETVLWNHDKKYLSQLAAAGVDVVPTIWLPQGEPVDWARLFEIAGADELIVKPTVSASAHWTLRVCLRSLPSLRAPLQRAVKKSAMMVQPFVEQVVESGEWSMVFIGGEYSHAVLKKPAAGDFRVQREFGGQVRRGNPGAQLIEQAGSALEKVPGPLLYARVDGVEMGGRLVVMELELIEPELFFASRPNSAARFAQAALTLIRT